MIRPWLLPLFLLIVPRAAGAHRIRVHRASAAQESALDAAVGGSLTFVNRCFEHAVGSHFVAYRRIRSLRISISAAGAVTDLIIVARPARRGANLRRCMLPLARGWHIPSATHADEVVSVRPERFARAVFGLRR